jgi:transposase
VRIGDKTLRAAAKRIPLQSNGLQQIVETRDVQRLEKLPEDAGIKLSAVASDILGVSGRAMLEALIAGNSDPAALADLAKRRLRSKIPALTEALTGRFTEHHAFSTRVHLDLIDQHSAAVDDITTRIEETMAPFRGFRDLICTIPGIGTLTADVIIAETGADMTRFPTAAQLASWAGNTPGNNESAGKVKSSRTRRGTPTCKGRSAPPRWHAPKVQAPTSAAATAASPRAADPRRPTSRSSIQC